MSNLKNTFEKPGQHDDARMCLSLALTASKYGAHVANHTEVLELIKGKSDDGQEVVSGAIVRDNISGCLRDVFQLQHNHRAN